MTNEELAVLRRFAEYLTTEGKLRYSEAWDAYVLVGETIITQEEFDLLYKIQKDENEGDSRLCAEQC